MISWRPEDIFDLCSGVSKMVQTEKEKDLLSTALSPCEHFLANIWHLVVQHDLPAPESTFPSQHLCKESR